MLIVTNYLCRVTTPSKVTAVSGPVRISASIDGASVNTQTILTIASISSLPIKNGSANALIIGANIVQLILTMRNVIVSNNGYEIKSMFWTIAKATRRILQSATRHRQKTTLNQAFIVSALWLVRVLQRATRYS